jgi:peptide/nickel transport system substrate-binding protein
MMEFKANPDYFRGKPKIDRVILKFGGNPMTELLSGNVDAITYISQIDILKLTKDTRFQMYHTASPMVYYAIYWKNDHPLFYDPRVRRALTMGINRGEMLKVFNMPDIIPLVDGVYTVRQRNRGQLPESLPYDNKQAKELLKDVGWNDG